MFGPVHGRFVIHLQIDWPARNVGPRHVQLVQVEIALGGDKLTALRQRDFVG